MNSARSPTTERTWSALYPATISTGPMPWSASASSWWSISGRPPISTRHFGLPPLSTCRRLPTPAARMIARTLRAHRLVANILFRRAVVDRPSVRQLDYPVHSVDDVGVVCRPERCAALRGAEQYLDQSVRRALIERGDRHDQDAGDR